MRKNITMRFVSSTILITGLLTGPSFAEDHFVQHGGNAFNPTVLNVEPGDVVSWGIGFPGGTPRTITSGENCVHDGLYFDAEIPPGLFSWEVPMDIGVTEIPYFNAMACKNGTPGLLRIIDIRRVPSEYATIQEALDAANPYDTILIAAGTYYETNLTPGDDDLVIQGVLDADGNPAVIIGPDPNEKSSASIMSIDGVDGLRIEAIQLAGNQSSTGAGMAVESGSLVVEDCVFSDNLGGGLNCFSADMTINSCTFRDNASAGGGGTLFDQSLATLDDCEFENNQAKGPGGAIASKASDLSVSDCRFESNSTLTVGGAIFADSSTLDIINSEARANVASQGGGLFLSSTQTSIASTRICGNAPDQIIGEWTDAGEVVVQDDCSILYVPEDFPTIDDAVEAARDGDTIMVAAGDYLPGSEFYSVEDTAVSIIGETNADGSPAVILSGALGFIGQGTTPIFVENMVMGSLGLYDCTAEVTNCQMIDGYDNFAGVLINQARGTLRNCRIADGNSAFLPGGVFISAQMDDAEILANDVDFIDCVIENNTGGCPVFGCSGNAGVRIEIGTVDFVGCSIRDNYASGYGGISMASQAVVSLTDTTVCGNSSSGQINGSWTDNGGNFIGDECPADCPGDFNGDGIVNGADFGALLAAWGACSECPEDLDGDGTVSGADVGLILSYWGDCATP